MSYTLPSLSYSYDSLEPYFDAQTMEIHHTKHHAAYVNGLNAALQSYPEYAELPVIELIAKCNTLPESLQTAVRNHGGGHANHSLFWNILTPGGASAPSGELEEAINAAFGSFGAFQEAFQGAAMGRFGSGWAWLGLCNDKTLAVCSTANQDNPLMGKQVCCCGCKPILGLDVWEHAYYLHFQNRRAAYVEAFWKVVNWDKVAELYKKAMACDCKI